jgi:hypothetical protein
MPSFNLKLPAYAAVLFGVHCDRRLIWHAACSAFLFKWSFSMPSTQNSKYRFTVKEGQPSASGKDDAPISLMLEPMDGELDVLKPGFLSIHLASGTTMSAAHELEKRLNSIVTSIGFTKM